MTTIRPKSRAPALSSELKLKPSPSAPARNAAQLARLRDQFHSPPPVSVRPVIGGKLAPLVGKKALDAFFAAHQRHSPAAGGFKELLAEGSVSPRTVARLEKQGVGAAEVSAVGQELEPFFAELGVAGEAMARTALDCLAAAGGELGRLAERGLSEVVDRSLPLHLADVLTRQLGPTLNAAGREVLQTGLISADSFAKLGAQGIGQLALALEVGLRQLGPLAQQAGGGLLRQAAEALGKASELLKPGASYQDFLGDFFKSIPASGQPLWEEKRSTQVRGGDVGPNGQVPGRGAFDQKPMEPFAGSEGGVAHQGDTTVAEGRIGAMAGAGDSVSGEYGPASGTAAYRAETHAAAEGSVVLGPTSADASGRVGAGASFHGEAAGALKAESDLGSVHGGGHAVADGEVFYGGQGEAHVGPDGAHVEVRAGAEYEASVSADVSVGADTLNGQVGAEMGLKGHAEARAAVQARAEGHVGFDEEGDVEAYVGVSFEAIAEAAAGVEETAVINFFGFKLTVGAFAAAAASVGAKASAGAGYRDGEFYAMADAGAGAAAGADIGGFVKLDMPPWAQAVMNTLGRTEAGRAALGAVGTALNPLIGAVAQAAAPQTAVPA